MDERILLLDRGNDLAQQSSKTSTFLVRSIFLFAISLALISKGLLISVAGPTLQYVARNTYSTVGGASYVISGLAIGICIGAVTMSYFENTLKDTKPLLGTGINLLVSSISIALTPFIHSLVLLVALRVIIGFTIGYYGTGMISVYVRKWGKIGSRPVMQLHTMMYSVGSFLAPIVAKSFLEMERHEGYPAVKCNPTRHGLASQPNGSDIVNRQSLSVDVLDDSVSWTFWIFGGYTFVVSIVFFILSFCKVLDKIPDEYDVDNQMESKEEQSANVNRIFIPSVFMFYFCLTAIQNLFGGYIYSIAVCSDLAMNVSKAALLNSVFWGGLISSRIIATLVSKHLKPSYILAADLTGIMSVLIAMSIWGESTRIVSWIGTFAVGFFSGTLFASGISWCSTVIRTDGKYGFVFYTGGSVGTTIVTPLGGEIFHIRPFAVVYLMSALCVLTIVFFLVMVLFALRYRTK